MKIKDKWEDLTPVTKITVLIVGANTALFGGMYLLMAAFG